MSVISSLKLITDMISVSDWLKVQQIIAWMGCFKKKVIEYHITYYLGCNLQCARCTIEKKYKQEEIRARGLLKIPQHIKAALKETG